MSIKLGSTALTGVYVGSTAYSRIYEGADLTFGGVGSYVPAAIPTLRALPGIDGYGTDTTAGRGGQVLVVSNTNRSGAGSLADALATAGARQIIFDTSGYITAPAGGFDIAQGQVSVYGQTARGDGICIRAQSEDSLAMLQVSTTDVLFQHVRFRCDAHATTNSSRDAVRVGDPNGAQETGSAVFDHCTITWGPDEVLELASGCEYVTVCNSLIYHGLARTPSNGTTYSDKLIMIASGAHHLSLHHNVLVTGHERLPLIQGSSYVDWWENIVAGTVGGSTDIQGYDPIAGTVGEELQMWINVQDNLYLDYRPSGEKIYNITEDIVLLAPVLANGMTYQAHISGNKLELAQAALTDARVSDYSGGAYVAQGTPFASGRPTAIGVTNLESSLLSHVGASKPARDSYDTSILAEITARSGTQAPDAVDGFPDPSGHTSPAGLSVSAPTLATGSTRIGSAPDYVPDSWKTANGLSTSTNAVASDSNSDGYYDIEDWLADLAT